MAQSDLETANSALYKIGTAKIASLAGTSKAAVVCNDRIDICKKALLAQHPWNFAVKRDRISPTFTTITGVTDNGGLFQCATGSTTGLSNGDRVTIDQCDDNTAVNGTWYIENVVTNTSFDLTGSTFAGATTTGRWTKAAKFDYSYSIAEPTDLIRVLRVNDYQSTPDWRFEGKEFLTQGFPLEVKYIYDVTDYDKMPIFFYESLAYFLAVDICQHLSSDKDLSDKLQGMFMRTVAKARFFDATEDPAEKLEANEWVESRFISPFVTNTYNT